MENYLDIKRKYEQGTVAEYDLIRADVTVKNTEPNLLQAENSLTLAKWQLKALLGMDLDLNIDCDGQLTDSSPASSPTIYPRIQPYPRIPT